MHLPKISVIIPCYNYARYVGQAIDSVLAQGYPALDLVVVNDGSTDDSLAVIRRHAPGATIIDQANQGQVAARNAGFAASTGDVVIFLDADDLAGTRRADRRWPRRGHLRWRRSSSI